MNNSVLMIKPDLILALCLRETESLSSRKRPPSQCLHPCLSFFISVCWCELSKKCLMVRCHIFMEMTGKDPPAVLIRCNAFPFSALITVGDHVMLPAISFVSCLKSLDSLSSVFYSLRLIPSEKYAHARSHWHTTGLTQPRLGATRCILRLSDTV